MDGLPTGPRKTVFGRVYFVPGTLVFVIADIKLNRRRTAEIHSVDVVVRTDCAHDLRLERAILTV
jgi:hypothetical protein